MRQAVIEILTPFDAVAKLDLLWFDLFYIIDNNNKILNTWKYSRTILLTKILRSVHWGLWARCWSSSLSYSLWGCKKCFGLYNRAPVLARKRRYTWHYWRSIDGCSRYRRQGRDARNFQPSFLFRMNIII